MDKKREHILFWIAIVSAILFLLFGFIWIYWIALIIAYPFGILSFLLWYQLRKYKKIRNNIIIYLLIIGILISISSLFPWFLRMVN